MLQNAYFLAKIGADTAENEQHFAEILPKTGSARQAASISSRRLEGLLSDAELKSKLAAKSASMMKMAKRAEIAATLEELTRDGANSQFVNQNDESPTAR